MFVDEGAQVVKDGAGLRCNGHICCEGDFSFHFEKRLREGKGKREEGSGKREEGRGKYSQT